MNENELLYGVWSEGIGKWLQDTRGTPIHGPRPVMQALVDNDAEQIQARGDKWVVRLLPCQETNDTTGT